jgi:hypothetical protein
MAFESIKNTELTPMIKPKLLNKGDKITGYFTGTWSSDKYPDAKSLVLVLSEPFKGETSRKVDGKEKIEPLNVAAGAKVLLNAGGNLKFFVQDQQPGYLYQFIYKGMKPITKGPAAGKDVHDFEILKDADATYDGPVANDSESDLPF